MELMEVIKKRRSIRKYADKPVEEAKLRAVLDAGRLAPSARNRQNWRFVVVQDADMRKKMVAAAGNQGFVAQAPVVIACCGTNIDHVMMCGEHDYPINVSIAMDHITLKAVEEGLGTCWIGAFDQDAVRALLGIPDDVRVVDLLALGYPAESPAARAREALDEIVMMEKWKG